MSETGVMHDQQCHMERLERMVVQIGGLLTDVARALGHVNGRGTVRSWADLPAVAQRIKAERDEAVQAYEGLKAWEPCLAAGRVDIKDPRVLAMYATDRAASKRGKLATPAELLFAADRVDPVRIEQACAQVALARVRAALESCSVSSEWMVRTIEAVLDEASEDDLQSVG